MSTLMNQKGSVMYVCRNNSQNFLALRYDGAAVIVTGELIKGKEFQADDIIEFDANPIGKAEAILYNTVKPKWKATRIKFLKHAEQWKGTAKVVTMDGNGEYCFLEGKDPRGVTYNIFCTRISVLPPVEKLSSIFSTGNTVRVICKEQVASAKNNQVKWRTVAATDMKHDLRAPPAALNSYEAIPIPPSVPKNAPKLRMAPTGPRPATAAAAVKSNSTNSTGNVQNGTTSPAPSSESPVNHVPPPISSTTTGLTIAQLIKDSLDNEARNNNNNSPTPSIGSQIPAPISPPTSANQDASFLPPGLDILDQQPKIEMSNLPIPSYEWMKFDLIQTLDTKYSNPPVSNIHEEHRKLREISHHLASGNCNFCLSH